MDKRRLASFYGVLVAALWGLSFLSIKVAVVVLPPMTLASARFVVACAVLPLVAWIAKEDLRIALRDAPVLILGGILGVTLYFYFENNGILLLSASESSIIVSTIPVVSVIAERVFLGARLPARVYLGSVLSFAGVTLIVFRPGVTPSSMLGYLYMAGAVIVWVAYTFATRKVSLRYGRLNVTFWQSLFGLAGCVPFALMESPAWRTPGTAVVLHVLYLGLICSAAGYWLYVATIDHLGVGKASIFINLIPVVAIIAAFFLLGDRLRGLQILGVAVTLTGVYLATTLRGRFTSASETAHPEPGSQAGAAVASSTKPPDARS
jgi:drug/metabolite transporter (DMT)-like permease